MIGHSYNYLPNRFDRVLFLDALQVLFRLQSFTLTHSPANAWGGARRSAPLVFPAHQQPLLFHVFSRVRLHLSAFCSHSSAIFDRSDLI